MFIALSVHEGGVVATTCRVIVTVFDTGPLALWHVIVYEPRSPVEPWPDALGVTANCPFGCPSVRVYAMIQLFDAVETLLELHAIVYDVPGAISRFVTPFAVRVTDGEACACRIAAGENNNTAKNTTYHAHERT